MVSDSERHDQGNQRAIVAKRGEEKHGGPLIRICLALPGCGQLGGRLLIPGTREETLGSAFARKDFVVACSVISGKFIEYFTIIARRNLQNASSLDLCALPLCLVGVRGGG
jgi:hypothetical protein